MARRNAAARSFPDMRIAVHLLPSTLLMLTGLLQTRNASAQFNDLALPLAALDRDAMVLVDSARFHALAEHLCVKFKDVPLQQWSNQDHINLMRCANTIMFERRATERFAGDTYQRLDSLINAKNYVEWITARYPKWIPNRGMGLYIPDLDMEMHGTPSLRGRFNVQ